MHRVLTKEEGLDCIVTGMGQVGLDIWMLLIGYEGDRNECGMVFTQEDDGSLTLFAANLVGKYGSEQDCTYRLEPDEWRHRTPGEVFPDEVQADPNQKPQDS